MSIEFDAARKSIGRPDTREISVVSVFDRYSSYPSHGLTPQRLASIFKEADEGDVFRQSELFEEMLEKDAHLFGIIQSRKLAVARRDYQIMAASAERRDRQIADFVRQVFDTVTGWRQAVEDLLDSIPKGFSVLQVMWKVDGEKVFVDRLEWTHQKNFRFAVIGNPKSDVHQIRRLTDADLTDGVELEKNKWVASIIKARSGHPSRTSLLRTCAWMYLFKNFTLKAWMQFTELFGMPLRVGKYSASTGEKEKEALLNALQRLASDASAMISDSTSIEFIEAAQHAAAVSHKELAEFCNQEMSKAVLGHTGTVESTPGKLGAEEAAREVRFDLVQSDALALDEVISDQLIRPLVDYNYGSQVKYPYYKTIIEPAVDRKELVELYDAAINRIKIPVGTAHLYEVLGIPQPKEGEERAAPRAAN